MTPNRLKHLVGVVDFHRSQAKAGFYESGKENVEGSYEAICSAAHELMLAAHQAGVVDPLGRLVNPEYEKSEPMPLMFAPDAKEWGRAFEVLGHSEEPGVTGPSLTLYRRLRDENQRLRNAIELLRPKQENYVDFENFDTAAEQWNMALEKAGVEHP